MCGPKHTGIGRYVENLADQLIDLKNQNKFKAEIILFVRKEDLATIRKKYGSKVNYRIADFPHYSLKEQLFLPKILKEARCDLVLFPHFNVPFFYQAPFAVTIHDLTKHSFGGQKATTRFLPFYYLKYLINWSGKPTSYYKTMMHMFFDTHNFGYRRFLKIDDLNTEYISEIQAGLPAQLNLTFSLNEILKPPPSCHLRKIKNV